MKERTQTTIPPLALLAALKPKPLPGLTLTPGDLRQASGPVEWKPATECSHDGDLHQLGNAALRLKSELSALNREPAP